MLGKKVVLAYSGGLDTSVILKWLADKGYSVIAYVSNVGQREDFAQMRAKALRCGAVKVYVEDLRRVFVTDYIFKALKANAVYEGRYLLGTALARPLIASRQIAVARMENAQYVSHGATGKGNDQVRFELSYYSLAPDIKVIAPWKMEEFLKQFRGRTDMLDYAARNGIEVKADRDKPYSEDENLLHISHEAGILEDPMGEPDESVFSRTVSPMNAPDRPERLAIQFKNGVPVKVKNLIDGATRTGALALFTYLNETGGRNGIGRVDMVENRFVGIKSRGVYETPAGTILLAAHRDIEGMAMDREVMRLRDQFSDKFAELAYNGFWFSPEMDFLCAAIDKSQEYIDGTVYLTLYKGNVIITGRKSPRSLYNEKLSSMELAGGFNQKDSEGFIKIHAVRLSAHNAIVGRRRK